MFYFSISFNEIEVRYDVFLAHVPLSALLSCARLDKTRFTLLGNSLFESYGISLLNSKDMPKVLVLAERSVLGVFI